jgi:hypothetical protein
MHRNSAAGDLRPVLALALEERLAAHEFGTDPHLTGVPAQQDRANNIRGDRSIGRIHPERMAPARSSALT